GGPDITVADDARLAYDYQVFVSSPPSAALNKGVDRANLYAQLPGQTKYFLVASSQAAAYSVGIWSGAAGGYVLFGSGGYLWSGGFGLQALAIPDPGSDALSLPVGTG